MIGRLPYLQKSLGGVTILCFCCSSFSQERSFVLSAINTPPTISQSILEQKNNLPYNAFTDSISLPGSKPTNLLRFYDNDALKLAQGSLQFSLGNSLQNQRFLASILTIGAANWFVYHQFNSAWWSESRSGFHFYKGYRRTRGAYDLAPSDSYYFHLDKAGHIYSSIFLTESLTNIHHWIGLSESRASWTGALLASLLMLEIEIYDGFFEEWGFSPGDFVANELGVLWVLLQRKSPALKGIRIKLSYDPRAPLEEDHWIKNYSAMTFWLSLPIHRWLPIEAQRVWPSWLNLAIGYGTDQLRHGNLEAYVALDLNSDALLQSNSLFVKPLRTFVNYLHLPMPALRFRPSLKFFPLHF